MDKADGENAAQAIISAAVRGESLAVISTGFCGKFWRGVCCSEGGPPARASGYRDHPMEAPGSRRPPVIADGRLDPDDRRGYFSIDRTSKLAGGRKAPPVGCPARWPGRLGRSPSGRSMPISTTTPSLPSRRTRSRQAQARKASPRISTIRWDHDQLRRAADDGSSTFGFYGWPILAILSQAVPLRSGKVRSNSRATSSTPYRAARSRACAV